MCVGGATLSLQLSLGFSGGTYGIYLIVGYLIKKGFLKKVKADILRLVVLLILVIAIGFQIWCYGNNYTYNIWYDSPFLLIVSAAIFELCSRIKKVLIHDMVYFV